MDVWPACSALVAGLLGVAAFSKLRRLLRQRAFRRRRPSPSFEATIQEHARKTAARAPHSVVALSVLTPKRELGTSRFGSRDDATTRADHVRFEIGSVTKVFTALVLARQIVAGRLKLDDTLGSLVPDWFPPDSSWAAASLEQLATHTSGLPRLPRGFLSDYGRLPDPYRDFGRRALDESFSRNVPRRSAAGKYHYSNYGYAILGEVCAARAGQSFKDLMHETVLAPLALQTTEFLGENAALPAPVAGRRKNGQIAPGWHFDAFAGAGGLVSSSHDLLRLARVHLQPDALWRGPVELCLQPRHAIDARRRIGLAWHCTTDRISDADIWWHNGGTGGYRAFVGMIPAAGVAVVLLSNSSPFDWWNGNIDGAGVTILRHALKLA